MRRDESSTRHTQSCRDCKRAVLRLLLAVAGERGVLQQHKLNLPTALEAYRGSPWFEALSAIHAALQQHRQHHTFIKRNRLAGVDYYLPGQRVVVEFDETQHFTEPRWVALSRYPAALPLGFEREHWMRLCRKLNRKDNTPLYRDEQRAWLDTLRDFSGVILDHRPTVRLYAGEARWCKLRADDPMAIDWFWSTYIRREK